MSRPIPAKNAQPGQRVSLDHDGEGRIVRRVVREKRCVRIYWTDGATNLYGANETLHIIAEAA